MWAITNAGSGETLHEPVNTRDEANEIADDIEKDFDVEVLVKEVEVNDV